MLEGCNLGWPARGIAQGLYLGWPVRCTTREVARRIATSRRVRLLAADRPDVHARPRQLSQVRYVRCKPLHEAQWVAFTAT